MKEKVTLVKTNNKKSVVGDFKHLAISALLVITLLTALLTYQLGHEIAVQIASYRSPNISNPAQTNPVAAPALPVGQAGAISNGRTVPRPGQNATGAASANPNVAPQPVTKAS